MGGGGVPEVTEDRILRRRNSGALHIFKNIIAQEKNIIVKEKNTITEEKVNGSSAQSQDALSAKYDKYMTVLRVLLFEYQDTNTDKVKR